MKRDLGENVSHKKGKKHEGITLEWHENEW